MWKNTLKKLRHNPNPTAKSSESTTISNRVVESTTIPESFTEYCKTTGILALPQTTTNTTTNTITGVNNKQTSSNRSPNNLPQISHRQILRTHQVGSEFELFDEEIEPSAEFYRCGQKNLPRELRAGKFIISARIDLHYMTKPQALHCLENILAQASAKSCLLIIHGNGTNSNYNRAVLRRMVRRFLLHHRSVLAYSYAAPHQGANGATLVKLSR